MKVKFLLLGSGLLAATLAVAQDMPATSSQENQDSTAGQTTQTTQSYQSTNNVIRGCLSGSAGNYTVTDQNGTQYSVAGPENQLQASVGHEVEMTTRRDDTNQSSAQGGQTTQSTTNTVQVSNIHDLASTCSKGNGTSTQPMSEDQANPKGTPDAAEPPQAQPQTIAMLQQQETIPANSTAPQQQATPPVTSQTPATPGASTSSAQQNAQQGATSSTTTSTTSTTTTSQPQSGTTPTTEQNAAQPAPNATTPGSDTVTPNTNVQPPQENSNSNDANKPLYERQATDIPWAHSGSNSGASNPSQQNPPQQ